MVMPCSRSASRPSVRRDRSISCWPRFCEARATEASWSSKMARVSCSSLPIRVLLPSSTLPAVMKRSTPRSSAVWGSRPISSGSATSEISFFFAPLHGVVGGLVVQPGRAALGDCSERGLGSDLGGSARRRFDRAGAADVAHRAESHGKLFHPFAFARRGDLGHWDEQSLPAHHASAVRIVDRGHGEPLAVDVLPDVQLGPVTDRKHPHVLALRDAGVVEAPQLRALVLRVPLTEFVAEREYPLLGARFLLVATRPPDRGIERELGDRLEQIGRAPCRERV